MTNFIISKFAVVAKCSNTEFRQNFVKIISGSPERFIHLFQSLVLLPVFDVSQRQDFVILKVRLEAETEAD